MKIHTYYYHQNDDEWEKQSLCPQVRASLQFSVLPFFLHNPTCVGLQYPVKTAHGLGFLSPQLLQTIRTHCSTFVSGLGDVLTGPRGGNGTNARRRKERKYGGEWETKDGFMRDSLSSFVWWSLQAHRCGVTGRHGAGGSPLMPTPPIHPWDPECTADEISQVWTGLESAVR